MASATIFTGRLWAVDYAKAALAMVAAFDEMLGEGIDDVRVSPSWCHLDLAAAAVAHCLTRPPRITT